MTGGPRPRPPRLDAEGAAALALQALAFLVADEARCQRLLALTGLAPDDLRARAADPALLGGVLDHVLGDETLVVAFAAEAGIAPERVAGARRLLPGAAPEW